MTQTTARFAFLTLFLFSFLPLTLQAEDTVEGLEGFEIIGDVCGEFEAVSGPAEIRFRKEDEVGLAMGLADLQGCLEPPPPGAGQCGDKAVSVPFTNSGVCYAPGTAGGVGSLATARTASDTAMRLQCLSFCLGNFTCQPRKFCTSKGIGRSGRNCLPGVCPTDPSLRSVTCTTTLIKCRCRCQRLGGG